MDKYTKYLLIGILTWVIVDFTTAFNPDVQRWLDHMPLIGDSTLFTPLVFAHLIYQKLWDGRKLFYATLIGAFTVKIIFSNNSLLYTYPLMLIMIPIAVAISPSSHTYPNGL